MRRQFIIALFVTIVGTALAQTVWDREHLAQVKASLHQPAYNAAYRHLLEEAEGVMQMTPPSVMQKDRTAASGDKHDYLSLSRYFWPDPTKADGLPYVNRDGVSNPELEQLDRNRLSEMTSGVSVLALAWYFSGEDRYAEKATELLRTWFINKGTRMSPNLNFAQIVPGQDGDKGRCYGLIDSYSFVEMLDAVQLLEASKAFTPRDAKVLKAWFSHFLAWMLSSDQGREEARQQNNHAIAFDAQVVAYATYVGNKEVAEKCLAQFYEQRIKAQIEPDGRQPHELSRTLAFGYSQYNLSHIIDILQMARKGSNPLCEKAADFLAQYIGRQEAWPYQQISGWDEKQDALCQDIYRLYLLNSDRTDYLKLAKTHLVKRWNDRFFLLYYTPDETDDAFAQAEGQLRYQLLQVDSLRQVYHDRSLMPRCVEKDGSLRMVGIGDWCSGFLSGELWMMYQYSHDPFWRRQAVTNTWRLEDNKWNGSSHDLGFMMYNAFGQAYKQTGEQSYRDVVLQTAQTLATRYDERVGCIRSWSWGTPELWKYAVIIDNMMNLELLFEASRLTGDEHYRNIAVRHANTTLKHHFRADGSCYHVVDYDPVDGRVVKRITHQGLFDESIWSRGQGWAIYGYTMCYRYTHDPAYLEQARKTVGFWFSQKDLPDDQIPYWDMRDPAIPDAPRDASAATIIASALYELAAYVGDNEAATYRRYANRIVHSLESNYQPVLRTAQGFLLLHSTGNYPAHDEIDVPINYADYYYLEALLRRAGSKG
jgi:hypothetical protein